MEAASGIYTRIIFPDALAKAEPHLSDLQKSMLDATPDCIKVISPDGKLLAMNRAGCLALGVSEDFSFGVSWLSLLPEDVHHLGSEALHEANQGRNARFPGKSTSPEGVRYWDNLLTPFVDPSGKVLSILCVSRDVTAKTHLEKQLEDAIERQTLLSREMQHRIKNLFSMVSGLIVIAEKEAGMAETPQMATTVFREKLNALSRASDAVFGQDVNQDFAQTANLETVIRAVLLPYGSKCVVVGEPLSIPGVNITTLTLFLHELATNSIKYGALGTDAGKVTVSWTRNDANLSLAWVETDGPRLASVPERWGFGSEMVDRIVRSSGGVVERTWKNEGLVVDLELPAFL